MIKAISFDVGGTLIEVTPSVGHIYSDVAARHGISVDPQLLNTRFKSAWSNFRNHTEQHDQRWWRDIVNDVFKPYSFKNKDHFFSDLYLAFLSPSVWTVYPEVKKVLEQLKDRGILLVVASNWDDRLPLLMKTLNLEHYFSHQFISFKMKKAKPNPDFFKHILSTLNIDAKDVIHVGDDEENDFVAPRKVNIQAYLLDRKNRIEGDHVIRNLELLVEKVDKHIHI